ncbi:hypothetical protein M595_1282 [Lyngbya aestuarii BL J]|uniref:Uncharacterized protein n=1 Tax=Lyngbya aestuarii BL J TaxID=1348334 RepID=U7QN90_9CYAN|nr:hypothetical protein M595_1282 [Lyngbya aestuarii BL J]
MIVFKSQTECIGGESLYCSKLNRVGLISISGLFLAMIGRSGDKVTVVVAKLPKFFDEI